MGDLQEQPKLPKGLALMVRNVLGVDPQAIFAEFQKAATTMIDFCKHFDMRMVNLTKEVRMLQEKIEQMERDRLALPKPDLEDKEHERRLNGTTATGDDGLRQSDP